MQGTVPLARQVARMKPWQPIQPRQNFDAKDYG